MRNELHHIEQIEKYLLGRFSKEEKIRFETALNASQSMQQDVRLQQQLVQRIKINSFAADIKDFHEQFSNTQPGWFNRGIILNGLIALGILGLSILAYYYFNQADNSSNNAGVSDTRALYVDSRSPQVNDTSWFSKKFSGGMNEETSCIKKDSTSPRGALLPGDTKKWIPSYLQVAFTEGVIDAAQSSHIPMKSKGSIIHIPPHVLIHKDGRPVTGKVQIKYREFRNAADIAFSNIPMTYHGDGSEKAMNSVGMFEIRAYQNGEELGIAAGKYVSVDYAVTQMLDSVYFFALDKQKQQWNKKFRIIPARLKKELKWGHGTPDYRNFNEAADSAVRARRDTIHTSERKQSEIVRNMRLSGFGTFNCDQVNPLIDKVNVAASYITPNGNKITNMAVLIVMDRNYNNALTYDPRNFACSKNGRNVLMLTTNDGHVYTLSEKNFKNMQIKTSGTYEFTVTDVTAKTKSLSDFEKLLGL